MDKNAYLDEENSKRSAKGWLSWSLTQFEYKRLSLYEKRDIAN